MGIQDLPVPDEATQRYYEEHAQSTFERMQTAQPGVEHYAPFLSLIPAGGQILDTGCGSGRDSRFFIQLGYEVTALGRLATESLGQTVLHLTFEEMAFESCFDGVWASHSLLHVPRTSLVQVLARVGCALKPGGVLFASFFYGQGELRRGGLLFNDFDESTFAEILAACPTLITGPAVAVAGTPANPAWEIYLQCAGAKNSRILRCFRRKSFLQRLQFRKVVWRVKLRLKLCGGCLQLKKPSSLQLCLFKL